MVVAGGYRPTRLGIEMQRSSDLLVCIPVHYLSALLLLRAGIFLTAAHISHSQTTLRKVLTGK